jgi:predicted lipoprotein with Yx(FWY)xxD motif
MRDPRCRDSSRNGKPAEGATIRRNAPPPSHGGRGGLGASSGTVNLAKSSLGPIRIESQGRTLYLWQADTGATSTRAGACALGMALSFGSGSTI